MNPLDLLSNLFKTGYNVYQDQRDYKYQKDLQQEIFERDDNALQRRMLDAQKAGINPLFAIGTGAGGVTSAGTMSSKPLSLDTNFFANQQLKKAEKQAMEQEKKKREIELKQMEIQLRAGKIANWQSMQDLNTKRLEQSILKEQLKNMANNNFYPLSNIGKIIGDVSALGNNILPFSITNPMPFFNTVLTNLGGKITPEMIESSKEISKELSQKLDKFVYNNLPKKTNEIKQSIQNFVDSLGQPVFKPKKKLITEYEARVLREASDKKVKDSFQYGLSHRSNKESKKYNKSHKF